MSENFRRGVGIGLWALVGAMSVSAQPYAYVANKGSNSLAIVNVSNGTLSGSVTVSPGADGVAVTPDGTTAYVSSSNNNNVNVVNLASKSVTTTIPVGTTPGAVAISPNGAFVYVVNVNSAQVTAISVATNTVLATISVGAHPTSVAFSPDSSRAYVTSLWGNNVSVINTSSSTVVNTLATGASPTAVAVSPDGQHLYVACQTSNSVYKYDTSGNQLAVIPGFNYPISIAITPNGAKAFVVNESGASLYAVDLTANTIVGKTSVGSFPLSVAISTDGTQAYVANEFGFSLSVIDTTAYSLVRTVASIGVYPTAVAAIPVSSGPTCTFQVTPGNLSFPVSGGTSSFTVTPSASTCSWGVTGPNWVTLTPSATSGNGNVGVSVNANTGTQGLSGTITVAGQQFTVTEAGITCNYTVTLTAGSLAYGVGGGTATISVVTSSPCSWTVSGPNWASLTPSGTSGGGTVGVSVGTNNTTQALSGTIIVAGQQFSVTEAGITCSYTVTLTAGNLSFPAAGGTATITVVTQSPCTWSASGPGWVTLGPSATAGNGTVGVTAAANNTINGLNGTITVANQGFPASEAGIPCTYALSGSTSLSSSAGNGSVTVTAPAGCAWTATDSVDSWITIVNGTGSGSGSATYSYSANNNTSSRQGTITIAAQGYGVTQAAFVFSPIRVNAGGPAYTDLSGNQWQADNGPGRSYSVTAGTITDPVGQFTPIYQKAAYAGGAGLTYTFTVPNGSRSVTLLYAETYECAAGRRPMSVTINGQPFDNVDIYALSGGMNIAYSSTYSTTVTNGQITITIAPTLPGASAMLSGLEIQ